MEKGFAAAFIVVLVIGAVIGLVVLTNVIEPLTHYTDTTGELMNLTGFGYLTPSISPLLNVEVYNDTNCISNQLTDGTDYIIDIAYNGDITGAQPIVGPVGNALSFADSDGVSMSNTQSKANIVGEITIIGWVKPQNI